MKIIGLTGTIGTGKSTVSILLRRKKIKIVDADKISREILNKGNTLKEIFDYFGEKIKNEDGSLNRKKLGSIVFSNEKELSKLNSITHPKIEESIYREIKAHKESGEKWIILDAPLLIEANLLHMVDWVLLVMCEENIQIKRIMDRDSCSKEQAILRINAQMKTSEKMKYADYIIDNSATLEALESQVEQFLIYLEGKGFE